MGLYRLSPPLVRGGVCGDSHRRRGSQGLYKPELPLSPRIRSDSSPDKGSQDKFTRYFEGHTAYAKTATAEVAVAVSIYSQSTGSGFFHTVVPVFSGGWAGVVMVVSVRESVSLGMGISSSSFCRRQFSST